MRIDDLKNKDLFITLPKTIFWSDYEKELDKVKNGEEVMRFKVSYFPRETKIGNRCYVVHNGAIRGWMEIVGFYDGNFVCSTTGQHWNGKFVERSGLFHNIKPIQYKGFQGWRYFNRKVK